MAFDCTYPGVPIEDAARLTCGAIAARAREHGLGSVYVVGSVRVRPHRWRRHVVDVVVHVADGDDILGTQFPDEAHHAVTAAVEWLRRERRAPDGYGRPLPSPASTPSTA